jgi:hypothetical protein
MIFDRLDVSGQVMRGGDKKFFWVLLFTLFTSGFLSIISK